MSCSRCGARDVRLIPAHWADRDYCPECALALEGRTPPARLAAGTFSVARFLLILDATVVSPIVDDVELDTDEHAWACCDICAAGSMVKRGTTPRCRITPRCEGRHVSKLNKVKDAKS